MLTEGTHGESDLPQIVYAKGMEEQTLHIILEVRGISASPSHLRGQENDFIRGPKNLNTVEL